MKESESRLVRFLVKSYDDAGLVLKIFIMEFYIYPVLNDVLSYCFYGLLLLWQFLFLVSQFFLRYLLKVSKSDLSLMRTRPH